MTIEHANIPDAELHEPKGTASASINETYVSNGAGSGSFSEPEPKGFLTANAGDIYKSDGAGSGTLVDTSEVTRMGTYNYDDLATAGSPIAIAVSTTPTKLTNDGAGALTFLGGALSDVANIWDTATDSFDLTDLSLYDKFDVRIDLEVTTTSANTTIETFITLDVGGLDIQLKVDEEIYKSSGTYEFTTETTVHAFTEAVRTGPTEIGMTSDSGSATCTVNGWAVTVFKKGLI